MNPSPGEMRRFLLGRASEEEQSAMEQACMADDAVFDDVEAQEEALIESYLAGTLAPEDSARFEQRYLASPVRRRRVETVRRLMAAAARPELRQPRVPLHAPRRLRRAAVWIALATAAVGVVATRMWLPDRSTSPSVAQPSQASSPAAPPATPEKPPEAIVAFSLSPMAARSRQDMATLAIPAGTTAVSLRLEGEPRLSRSEPLQVVLRTVDGTETWRGPARPLPATPGVLAEAKVPAAVLEPDDYLLDLFDSGPGRQQPIASYFVRVRR